MKGSCLCGAVTIATADVNAIDACHCGMCRKWGGGPLLVAHCGTNLTLTGEQSIRAYQSSEWAERAFCEHCGTHLYYHLLPGDQYMVPAGLFDTAPAFDFHEEIFIDKKPAYYAFSNDTTKLTEAEFLAKYAPE